MARERAGANEHLWAFTLMTTGFGVRPKGESSAYAGSVEESSSRPDTRTRLPVRCAPYPCAVPPEIPFSVGDRCGGSGTCGVWRDHARHADGRPGNIRDVGAAKRCPNSDNRSHTDYGVCTDSGICAVQCPLIARLGPRHCDRSPSGGLNHHGRLR
jgi:hypothetical protein